MASLSFATAQTIIARYWLWILIAFDVVLLAIGGFFFVIPEYGRFVLYSADELAARETEIQGITQETRQLKAALNAYTAIDETRVQLVRTLLPEKTPFADLLSLIARVAERAGFSIASFSVQASGTPKQGVTNEKQSTLLQVSLAGKGYRQWKQFLDLMERQLPLMDLVTTDFRPQNTHQQFTFRTYILP